VLCIGLGIDIYVFAEGIDYDHEEFQGRAFYGQYTKLSGQAENCSSSSYGTYLASLAVGKSVGVASKANVYRYICMCVWSFCSTNCLM